MGLNEVHVIPTLYIEFNDHFLHSQDGDVPLLLRRNYREPSLEGPRRKPRRASVFGAHSDTQAAPAFHCIRMFKGIFSTRAFLKRTDMLSTIA